MRTDTANTSPVEDDPASPPRRRLSKATGVIVTVDAAHHRLLLLDGRTFYLPRSFKLGRFGPGDPVLVTYTFGKGRFLASRVRLLPSDNMGAAYQTASSLAA